MVSLYDDVVFLLAVEQNNVSMSGSANPGRILDATPQRASIDDDPIHPFLLVSWSQITVMVIEYIHYIWGHF